MAKSGEFVADPTDPKNRVGADGLTQHDREWDRKLKQAHAETHRAKFIMAPLGDAWSRIFGNGQSGQRRRSGGRLNKPRGAQAPAVHAFTPEYYPSLGKVIHSGTELRAEMRRQGKEHLG